MSSTTKFNQFDEDSRLIGRSDDSKHFMRKSKKFGSTKSRGCACQCRQREDYWSGSDEEDSKPCCGFSDHRKCKKFFPQPNKDSYESRNSKQDKQEFWTNSEEKAFKLREKQKCKCRKNVDEDAQSKKSKADKRVISIFTKPRPDGLPPQNKNRSKNTKSKKSSKLEDNSVDLIKICRNEGDNGNNSNEEIDLFDSESSFYASRSDNYRRILGPTIDETVLVCLDLLTNIAMKINMFHCFSGKDCKTKATCRRKCMRTTKKELEEIQSSSESSDS